MNGHPVVWTEERKAVLRETYPFGVPIHEIVERINRLRGPSVTKGAAETHAQSICLRRPSRLTGSPPPSPDHVKFRPNLIDDPSIEPVMIDWLAAMDWGARNGVILGADDEETDLARVNALRRQYNLPPYRIMETGRRGKLPPVTAVLR